MALQPTRPAGSSHVLVFEGSLALDTANKATYPKDNAEVPSDAATTVPFGLRFLLGDATDPTDLTTTLPSHVFDDAEPAGAAPHASTTGAAFSIDGAPITTATDNVISDRTWCQNTYITIEPLNAAAAAVLTTVYAGQTVFVLDDDADSGLGLQTGLPVAVVPVVLTFAEAYDAISVRVTIEVRHTTGR